MASGGMIERSELIVDLERGVEYRSWSETESLNFGYDKHRKASGRLGKMTPERYCDGSQLAVRER